MRAWLLDGMNLPRDEKNLYNTFIFYLVSKASTIRICFVTRWDGSSRKQKLFSHGELCSFCGWQELNINREGSHTGELNEVTIKICWPCWKFNKETEPRTAIWRGKHQEMEKLLVQGQRVHRVSGERGSGSFKWQMWALWPQSTEIFIITKTVQGKMS